jgi:predicted nucleotide-binding protein
LSREDFPASEEDGGELISLQNSNNMQTPSIQDLQGPVLQVSAHPVAQRSAAAMHQHHDASSKVYQGFDGRDIANAENEALRAEIDKLKYALSVAHKAEMHAKELLLEERISKQNLQSVYHKLEEQYQFSLEEAREAGVKQMRDNMAQEWQEVSRLKSLAEKVRTIRVGSRRRARC